MVCVFKKFNVWKSNSLPRLYGFYLFRNVQENPLYITQLSRWRVRWYIDRSMLVFRVQLPPFLSLLNKANALATPLEYSARESNVVLRIRARINILSRKVPVSVYILPANSKRIKSYGKCMSGRKTYIMACSWKSSIHRWVFSFL